jgi:mazG nucleotide pyrophosphohydrolase domain protein
MVVTSYGIITTEHTDYSRCGVRPLCKLSDETEVEVECPSEETEDITELIKKWATDRNVTNGDTKSQMVKLFEEAGELAEGINKNKQDLIIDSIGDVYVVLVILCMQLGLDINDCIKAAYEEIKDRKGKLVNGLFVKEEDL